AMTATGPAIAVVTTVGDKKEARRMAQALVEGGLAACAQVEKIDSVYAWKGKIEHGKEYRVLFKTVEARYEAVERAIRELHSYELPALHAVPFTHISAPYAAWRMQRSRGVMSSGPRVSGSPQASRASRRLSVQKTMNMLA